MIKELELTDDERRAIRNEITSDAWKPVARVLDYLKERASWAYNNAREDHRFLQGKLHGIFEVAAALEDYSKPVETREEQAEEVPDMAILHAVSSATDY